jgi:hypothetical protein
MVFAGIQPHFFAGCWRCTNRHYRLVIRNEYWSGVANLTYFLYPRLYVREIGKYDSPHLPSTRQTAGLSK